MQPDRLLELRSNHASAAALRTGEVVFSSAAIAHLSTEQLIAIGRHELHHIDESRRAWAIRLVPVLMAIGFGPAMVLPAGPYVFLIAVLGFGRLFRWWSRRSETRADAAASGHPGDEGVYATALEDFYRLGRIPITSRGSTHPDLHDRLEAVGAKPNYRRPAPPDRVYVLHGLIGSAVVAVLVWVGTLVLVQATAGRTQSYMAVATGQDTEQTLPNLIIQEILEGNHERADELAEFALTEMKPAALESTLVRALDGLGSCDSIQFDTTKVKSPPLSAALAACG
ncbi:MAG: M48 family metalloprotease [Actinomycetia bacterium]|nr:M48 family metalloprotease [Actinomycetes bacterium]